MKLLILGGTIFLGRHLAELGLARGHRLTLFNRGRHNPDLFPQARRLQSDRRCDLSPLKGEEWDAVIDTSGQAPSVVRASASMLAGQAAHYVYISSASVYEDVSSPGVDEDAPMKRLADPIDERLDATSYGGLKARCEREAELAFPGRALHVRAGLIVGPHDAAHRFSYWPARVARGGTVLAPGPPQTPIQLIDVRDLAGWILDMVEARRSGVFNATSPRGGWTMEDLLTGCRHACCPEATVTWVPTKFLVRAGVVPWAQLPVWLGDDPSLAGAMAIDTSRAIAAGLRCRPLSDTAADTYRWYSAEHPLERRKAITLRPSREAELLAAWEAAVNRGIDTASEIAR